VDRLGERLRHHQPDAPDLRLLDSFRRTFLPAYKHVIRVIRDRSGLEPTGRPAKSTTSIIDKLRRESVRLSQMQDIAGCRTIVEDSLEQDSLVEILVHEFEEVIVVNRRLHPSHGYRAVHLVATVERRIVEIQIRTRVQHAWAELSEKLSDRFDPRIKYGEGDAETRTLLNAWSSSVGLIEDMEQSHSTARQLGHFGTTRALPAGLAKDLEMLRAQLREAIASLSARIAEREGA
jgi:ppGpp synthetase/RelA/SpoT-type nucleotidyltranferase